MQKNETLLTLVLGTQNGKTFDRYFHRVDGIEFEWHLRDLISVAHFITVLPPIGEVDDKTYAGGYTVVSHSSRSGISAVQIEFNKLVRGCQTARMRTAALVAEAIIRHYHSLPSEEPKIRSNKSNSSVKHKIFFLDIDEVLCTSKLHRDEYNRNPFYLEHPTGTYPPLELACLQNLKNLLDKSGAKIVVSSSWRLDIDLMKFFRFALEEVHINWEDILLRGTPDVDEGKGLEMRTSLEIKSHQCEGFVIIDDSNEVSITNVFPPLS